MHARQVCFFLSSLSAESAAIFVASLRVWTSGPNNKCFTANGRNDRKNTDSLSSSDLTSPSHYRKNTNSRSMSLSSLSETLTCGGTTVSTTSSSQSCQNDQSETEKDVQAES